MRDEGEPVSKGQIDRRAEDAKALRNALFAVVFFTGVVLVNGILAILLIALLQALGLWGATATMSVPAESTDELRSTIVALARPSTMHSMEA
jgi:hypothetical protein